MGEVFYKHHNLIFDEDIKMFNAKIEKVSKPTFKFDVNDGKLKNKMSTSLKTFHSILSKFCFYKNPFCYESVLIFQFIPVTEHRMSIKDVKRVLIRYIKRESTVCEVFN